MNKLQSSIYSVGLLFFILLLTFCHKEEPKPVPESPKPVTFYIQNTKDGKPESDVFITLQKKVANQVDSFENVTELGKTDAAGKLTWNYDKTSLPGDHRFVCNKQGYLTTIIPITDLLQRVFEGAMTLKPSTAVTFYIVDNQDSTPVSDVVITLQKKTSTLPESYENVLNLGKTDASGRLIWNYDKTLLPENHRFVCDKQGYLTTIISISDLSQHEFQGSINPASSNAITFYVYSAKDGLPVPNAVIDLYNKIGVPDAPYFLKNIGTTSANGKVVWNYDLDSLPKTYQFWCHKSDEFDPVTVLVTDSYQNDFQIALSRISKMNFHLKYQNDTLPKEFVLYNYYFNPPYHNYPGGYAKYPYLITGNLTKIDTSFTIKLDISSTKQEFHCYMLDQSTPVNSYLNFPNSPEKVLVIPGGTKDTTFLFEAFW
ncbi:MAG: DUF2606 family protein [Bacteroidota bacterium]